jgi:hypothetical protein
MCFLIPVPYVILLISGIAFPFLVRQHVWAGYSEDQCVAYGGGMPWAFGAIGAFVLLVQCCAWKFGPFVAIGMIVPELIIIIGGCASGIGFARSTFSLNYYKTLPTLDNTTFSTIIDRPDIFVYNFGEPYPDWKVEYGIQKTVTKCVDRQDENGNWYSSCTDDFYYCVPAVAPGDDGTNYPVCGDELLVTETVAPFECCWLTLLAVSDLPCLIRCGFLGTSTVQCPSMRPSRTTRPSHTW